MRKFSVALLSFILAGFSSFAAFTNTFTIGPNDIFGGFIVKKVWLQQYATPGVKLTDIQYKNNISVPGEAVPSDPSKFEVVVGKERKRPFALIRIPAYSLDPATGKARQISEFSVSVEESAVNPLVSPAMAKSTASATTSVLATGNWYKISVPATGYYKIDYDFLANKLGVSPNTLNTANIRVYGNGGRMLSENNAVPRADDLIENPVWVSDGGDGAFGQGDYVVFYATGSTGWFKDSLNGKFNHAANLYDNNAYYFLNFDLGAGQRVPLQVNVPAGNVTVNDFDHYYVYEKDLVNPAALGKEWWGEEFSNEPGKTLSQTFTLDLGNLTQEPAKFRIWVGARSDAGGVFTATVNGVPYSVSLGSLASSPMPDNYINFQQAVSGMVTVSMDFQPGISTGKGFLNYIEVNARKPLSLSGVQQLLFRDWRSVGQGKVATYQLQGAGGSTQVWDVTDPLRPVRMDGALNGSTYTFTQDATMLHEFAAINGSDLPVPAFVGKVANQNLHGTEQVDYLIVTHPLFINEANELADFHRQRSGLSVKVATTNEIYNEFSSGSQDISAIRDFARMLYIRAGMDSTLMPRYMLLFGDASYDYKDRLPYNSNYVPTFESREFRQSISSYCNDDFFSFLDDNEDIENFAALNTMDLGVGRFPVTTVQSAQALLRKVKNYKSPASFGPWKLSTTMIADNSDQAGDHMGDAETMGSTVVAQNNIYNTTKVYVNAMQRISTPAGLRAPDANKMINDQIFKGTFLVNYNGHGNIQVLADERVIIQDDYSKWRNFNKLPIMITATCDYGPFDHPEYVSSGEAIMLKSDGGAIAILTTTQLVYASDNHTINRQFLEDQFAFNNGKNYSFGDAFRIAKNMTYQVSTNSGTLINFRKFALLGDPALTPAFPEQNIKIDSLNDGITMAHTDTIKALGSYVLSGKVVDDNNVLLGDFNGRVYVTIYDKPRNVQTINGEARSYQVQNNVIYKGRATAENGKFSMAFIAPKDINYDLGACKISAYAENGVTDAAGADTAISVGGFSDNPVQEDMPPVVMPYIEDSLFRDGGITGPNTLLYVMLEDETGINVSGNTVGHDLTAVLDDDLQNPYILNDYYETAPNTYKRGYVYFPMTGLSNGKHSLRIKAWDVNNNSGEGIVNFEVMDGAVVKVNNLMNYPNPFSTKTNFVFEHNHPDEALAVSINIYSTAGSLVRTIRQNFTPTGSRSTEISWDGTDNDGAQISSGLYVYKLDLATGTGIHETAYQKLVIIR